MKPFFLSLLLFLARDVASFYYFGNANPGKIVFLFHGHGSNCAEMQAYVEAFSGAGFSHVFCVASGEGDDSVLVPLLTQIKKAADFILQVKGSQEYGERFRQGVYFVGVSQGGIIARMVFNGFDHISNYVRRIVTLGSPNTGLEELKIFDTDFKNAAINFVVTSWIGRRWAAANFYAGKSDASVQKDSIDPNDLYYYLNCAFDHSLLDNLLHSEYSQAQRDKLVQFLENCAQIKSKYQDLEMFVTLMFADDHLILPPNSAIFRQEIEEVDPAAVLQAQTRKMQFLQQQSVAANKQFVQAVKHNLPTKDQLAKQSKHFASMFDLYFADNKFLKDYLSSNPGMKFSTPVNMAGTQFFQNNILHLQTLVAQSSYLSCALHREHVSLTFDEIIHLVVRPLTLWSPRNANQLTQEEQVQAQRFRFIDRNYIYVLKLFCDFDLISGAGRILEQDSSPRQPSHSASAGALGHLVI